MIRSHPLPYVDHLDMRELSEIHLLVVHCTELPDLASARGFGEQARYTSGTGNSGHFYIDRDGAIEEYVPVERIAHHTRGWNAQSIGIELVNLGRHPDWLDSRRQQMTEPYPAAQIDALLALIKFLQMHCPALTHIAGHEDLDLCEVPATDDAQKQVRRKRDPGPMFPWAQVIGMSGLRRRYAAEIT